MTPIVRIYFSNIPRGCNGLVFPAFDPVYGEQYIILINEGQDLESIHNVLVHELWHVWNNDWDVIDGIDKIEKRAHAMEDLYADLKYSDDFQVFVNEVLNQEILYRDLGGIA